MLISTVTLVNYFVAQIQKLKHSITKGDKKKKKEVTEQIARLEAELDARHEQELKELKQGKDEVRTYFIGISKAMCIQGIKCCICISLN